MSDGEASELERLPVSVITGFLGSGKTTLLKNLLQQPDMADTAVVINEFGEIGLDHLLVEEAREDTILMSSGCLCCSIRGDLIDTLRRLYKRRDRGEVPRFKRLVIETTGLADPAPILQTLIGDPLLGAQSGLILPRWNSGSGQFADGSATIREAFERLVSLYGTPGESSPALEAAFPSELPPDDILGTTRPQGETGDLGAVERIVQQNSVRAGWNLLP